MGSCTVLQGISRVGRTITYRTHRKPAITYKYIGKFLMAPRTDKHYSEYIMLRPVRQILTLLLAAVFYTGGSFSWACSPEACRGGTICRAVQCSCCCDCCSQPAAQRNTPKPAAPGQVQCPLVVTGNAQAISCAAAQPMNWAGFDKTPVFAALQQPMTLRVIQIVQTLSRASPLSMSCALTT